MCGKWQVSQLICWSRRRCKVGELPPVDTHSVFARALRRDIRRTCALRRWCSSVFCLGCRCLVFFWMSFWEPTRWRSSCGSCVSANTTSAPLLYVTFVWQQNVHHECYVYRLAAVSQMWEVKKYHVPRNLHETSSTEGWRDLWSTCSSSCRLTESSLNSKIKKKTRSRKSQMTSSTPQVWITGHAHEAHVQHLASKSLKSVVSTQPDNPWHFATPER